jgi:hypothetical protein
MVSDTLTYVSQAFHSYDYLYGQHFVLGTYLTVFQA